MQYFKNVCNYLLLVSLILAPTTVWSQEPEHQEIPALNFTPSCNEVDFFANGLGMYLNGETGEEKELMHFWISCDQKRHIEIALNVLITTEHATALESAKLPEGIKLTARGEPLEINSPYGDSYIVISSALKTPYCRMNPKRAEAECDRKALVLWVQSFLGQQNCFDNVTIISLYPEPTTKIPYDNF